ncbi:MAG: amidophosphoribosyltransferase [Chitinophagales bacterium]|nr:MAG: amidophosphoribosyltransferase [Chitinophagales bacterium]
MHVLDITREYLSDFIGLFFPHSCEACGRTLTKGEDILCLFCLYAMPQTHYHLEKDNPAEKLFWGRADVQRAAALYFYHSRSRVQHLLHAIKYHGKKEIAYKLGHLYGSMLSGTPFAEGINLIVPVPLHEKKKRQRGYNQSDYFAMGLSESMEIPWSANILKRKIYTQTQTAKSRFERWGNVHEVFFLPHAPSIQGKHILLVDDVITTGATLEACTHTLQQAEAVKVSIAAIAIAH